MKDKFLIKDLSSIAIPFENAQSSYTIVENDGITYKAAVEDLYRDIIVKRLSVEVSRPNPFGPNILSIMYCDENGLPITTTSVQLQDGMLSTAKYNGTNHILSLYFNNTLPASPSPNPITVDLAELKDIYTAGYGLAISGDKEFYISASYIPQLEKGNNQNVIAQSSQVSVTTGKAVYDYVQPQINQITTTIQNIWNYFGNYIPQSEKGNNQSVIESASQTFVTTGRAVYDYVNTITGPINNNINILSGNIKSSKYHYLLEDNLDNYYTWIQISNNKIRDIGYATQNPLAGNNGDTFFIEYNIASTPGATWRIHISSDNETTILKTFTLVIRSYGPPNTIPSFNKSYVTVKPGNDKCILYGWNNDHNRYEDNKWTGESETTPYAFRTEISRSTTMIKFTEIKPNIYIVDGSNLLNY